MSVTSQSDAALKLGFPQVTLFSLLKRQETLMGACDGDRKQMCIGKAPVVEAVLAKLIENAVT